MESSACSHDIVEDVPVHLFTADIPPLTDKKSDWNDESPSSLPDPISPATAHLSRGGPTGLERKRAMALVAQANNDHHLPVSIFGKQPTRSLAPFLTKHIPPIYASLGTYGDLVAEDNGQLPKDKPAVSRGNSNTKFCYRHQPDLKCHRQADEPSMAHLQNELASLPESDKEGITHVWSLFSAAPSKHRNLMLQGILASCCFPQLSFISASVRDLIKIDFLSVLPAEISLKILCFLDPTSICKSAQVSRRWRSLADDDVVWHRMCEQHIDRKCKKCGWGLPTLDRVRLRSEKRQMQLRAKNRDLFEAVSPQREMSPIDVAEATNAREVNAKRKASPDIALGPPLKRARTPNSSTGASSEQAHPQPWKDVYRDRHRIGRNWKYGRYSQRTFKGHTNGVMCLQYDGVILASGSYDSTIKIWNMHTGEELRTLEGHRLGVRCLQFDDSKLASGSLDGTVRIWDHHSGKLLSTLRGHTGGVTGVHFEGELMATGSEDHTIRLWDFKERSSTVLRGHDDWVNCVKIHSASRTLLSSSDDCTIRLWDIDTKKTVKIYEGHKGQVQQVMFMPADFEPELEDGGVDVDPMQALKFESDDDIDRADTDNDAAPRPRPPRYMLSGALDATLKLWDVYTGKCVRTFFGHLEGVWGLAADSLRCVSGANDGLVKVWDVRTGVCDRTLSHHHGPVSCVALTDRWMCTGSEDHEIRMYSFCVEGTERF